MEYHLAQINIARMLAPLDSDIMKDFVANLDRINALAEESNGFVWRLKEDGNNATSIRIYDDEFFIVNMSVWKGIDELHEYVYRSAHKEVLARRSEWFERMKDMHMVLWYVPAGHNPTVAEAEQKLNQIRENGPQPSAFNFKNRYSVSDFQEHRG